MAIRLSPANTTAENRCRVTENLRGSTRKMLYSIAADALLVIHLLFIVFVMAGGLLVMRWRWLALAHLPAVTWGVLIELNGWICPLTPLENSLRLSAGEAGLSGGFIEHYLLPIIYPRGLTADIQVILATVVIAVNIAVYGYLLFAQIQARDKT